MGLQLVAKTCLPMKRTSVVSSILETIAPHANTFDFDDLVFSGGTSRRTTYPFLVAGLCGLAIICYFLSVGASAGVWTAVALSNSLYAGRLADLHSLYNGKIQQSIEPSMKTYVSTSVPPLPPRLLG